MPGVLGTGLLDGESRATFTVLVDAPILVGGLSGPAAATRYVNDCKLQCLLRPRRA